MGNPLLYTNYTFQNMGYTAGKAVQGLSIIYRFNIHYIQMIWKEEEWLRDGGGILI